jgi:hypothetical protein
MKQICVHCLSLRERALLFESEDGNWTCRDVLACLESYANLPEWLRV